MEEVHPAVKVAILFQVIGLTCDPEDPMSDHSILSILRNGCDSITVPYEHPLLRFLTAKEARVFRSLCSECLDATQITPWSDLDSPIGRRKHPLSKSIACYKQCFPMAKSANVVNWKLTDVDIVQLRTFQFLRVHSTQHKWFKQYNRQIIFGTIEPVDPMWMHVKNELGRTPLLSMAYHRDYMFAKSLLETGADLHVTDDTGHTALHLARGSPAMVKLLLDHGANVHAKAHAGDTPLHCALYRGADQYDLPSIKLLLEAGASVHTCTRKGLTPLHYLLNHRKYYSFRQEVLDLLETYA
jgi:hypothetical protein